MGEFFHIMALPLLVCLILMGIHAYLGLHVIERQVNEDDLALAQIAVLGSAVGLMFGVTLDSWAAYLFSLGFTIVAAVIFALTRLKNQKIPQEAIIGIAFVFAAALLMIVLNFSGEGDQHIRESLAGNILLVDKKETVLLFVIYSIIGFLHFIFRRNFYLISRSTEDVRQKGISVKFWDFLFYVSFGFVVTSSVKIAGVLLVFSYLIIPASAALLFSDSMRERLTLGWVIGTSGSLIGILASYYFNWPTAASIVCALTGIFILLSVLKKLQRV